MDERLEYLLDTDMCVYLLNGNDRLKNRVAAVGVQSLAVAVPTVAELCFGAHNSARVKENLERVRDFPANPGPAVLPIDDAAAESFGESKARLRREGQPISDFDLLIAGVAASAGLAIVTNNTEHFKRIPDLALENWLTL